jgi:Kef-type K+ transport system membrane component KefB
LFFVLIFYSSLDVHPIIGAFLVGFLLSEISQSKLVKEKLNTIGYALFIPVYLFITGVKINPQLLFELTPQNYLALLLIGGALFSKVISGFLGARLARFSSREASVIGISSSTKLTVTISSALIALSMGLIDDELYSAILMTVVLSIIINPALMYLLMKKKTPADHV